MKHFAWNFHDFAKWEHNEHPMADICSQLQLIKGPAYYLFVIEKIISQNAPFFPNQIRAQSLDIVFGV